MCPCFTHGYDVVQKYIPFSAVVFQVEASMCIIAPLLLLRGVDESDKVIDSCAF